MKVFLRCFFRILFTILIVAYVGHSGFAQKQTLDHSAIITWPKIKAEKISNDGKFAMYSISSMKMGTSLIVQSTDNQWKTEIAQALQAQFTNDTRHLIFSNRNDSLGILDLVNKHTHYVSQVSSFKEPIAGDGRWLGYLKGVENEFILYDFLSDKEKRYSDATDYLFDSKGEVLLLTLKSNKDSIQTSSLVWINLLNGRASEISHQYSIHNVVFDRTGSQLVFLAQEFLNGQNVNVLKYYKVGMDSANVLVEPVTSGMKGMIVADYPLSFSKSGNKIFFGIRNHMPFRLVDNSASKVNVDILNYKDEILQPERLYQQSFLSVINLDLSKKVIRLQEQNDYYLGLQGLNEGDNDNYYLAKTNHINILDKYKWSNDEYRDFYLVSTNDGNRKLIKKNLVAQDLHFSLMGKYLLWYDKKLKQWYTYRIKDGIIKCITKGISKPLYTENDTPTLPKEEGMAGWLEKDSAILIFDRNDIWMVDPDGVKPPVNLTLGYGAKHNIQFRYMDFDKGNSSFLHMGDTLLLSAFNISTKYNGFFKLRLGREGSLQKLIMGPDTYYYQYRFQSPVGIDGTCEPEFPLKATGANTYIVQRMNANKYPNLYITTDFKNFKLLTNLEPQRKYNWYNTELVHWKLPNGMQNEGILYKPEDFDPHKKYPIIFYYYERNADAVHLFIHPEFSDGCINIPSFVSNGYLVFVPDIICYKKGYPGECAYQAVTSAAHYLKSKSWVDTHRMGLQGHSYAGWETNYIVSKSQEFAAAAPSSAYSDLVSLNGQEGKSRAWYFESGQGRIGFSFWSRPDLYFRNSPMFKANKVSTPILIMHNKTDYIIPFLQDVEWFNALNRFGKKVWLLSYDGEGHIITDEKNKMDYSVRLAQFFDHYLRGAPSPMWMTRGVHISQKGIDSGLEIDVSDKKP